LHINWRGACRNPVSASLVEIEVMTWFERLGVPSINWCKNHGCILAYLSPISRNIKFKNRVSKWIVCNWGISKSKNPISTVWLNALCDVITHMIWRHKIYPVSPGYLYRKSRFFQNYKTGAYQILARTRSIVCGSGNDILPFNDHSSHQFKMLWIAWLTESILIEHSRVTVALASIMNNWSVQSCNAHYMP
jgi:hypothetical protein